MLTPDFHPFPELETERLLLRQMQEEDADHLFLLRSDQNVMKYLDRPLASSPTEVQEFIQNMIASSKLNNGITWAIALKPNPQLIGTIGFWKIDKENHRAEIGYMLAVQWHNKGIMNEAMKPVLEYGFKIMNLHSVEANVNPANEPSISLLGKNQFVREAYYKENYFYNGTYIDSAIYSLLNPYQ